ncbi:MAG: hypothetical protein GQ534_12460 [Candidatus Delongbacteria bacterium]|nr:hypothetical protein [Candidatus Delongbacteria bacterium]
MAKKELIYSPELKEKAIKLAIKTDIRSASSFYKLNRKTVGKWVSLYKNKGVSAYLHRKKRNDKQDKKISKTTFNKIIKFKEVNPKVTLNDIKQEFGLNCSNVLISRKLKEHFNSKIETREQILTVTYNIIKHTKQDGLIKTRIYQFSLYDSLTHNQYFGISTERNLKNLSIFIFYIISQLKEMGYISANVKILTNIYYLKQLNSKKSVNDKSILPSCNIPIVIDKKLNKIKSNISKIASFSSKKDIMISAYEATIMCNGNTILIHPINIDDYTSDSSKIDYLCVSDDFSSEILTLTLEKIEYYADKAMLNFEIETADNIYNKIYLTSLQYTCSKGKTIKIKSLYKRAKIFYHIDDYKTAKSLFQSALKLSESCQNLFQIGYIYYHLGMIYMIENNLELSDKNLTIAINEFLQSSRKEFLFDYYKANVKKHIHMGSYDTALRYAHKYLKAAKNQRNKKQICEAYDIRGEVYFRKAMYKYAEKDYLKQKDIAHDNNLYKTEVKSINSLLSIYTYNSTKPIDYINKLTDRLTYLSKKTKKDFYLYLTYHLTGNLYYYKQKYFEAIPFYKEADTYLKKINDKFNIVRNTHYLGCCYFELKENLKALACFRSICINYTEQDMYYVSYSYNYMGRIYLDVNKIDLSLTSFKKSIKIAKIINNFDLISDGLKSIGVLFAETNHKKAFNYFRRSLNMYNKLYRKKSLKLYETNIKFIKDNLKYLNKI